MEADPAEAGSLDNIQEIALMDNAASDSGPAREGAATVHVSNQSQENEVSRGEQERQQVEIMESDKNEGAAAHESESVCKSSSSLGQDLLPTEPRALMIDEGSVSPCLVAASAVASNQIVENNHGSMESLPEISIALPTTSSGSSIDESGGQPQGVLSFENTTDQEDDDDDDVVVLESRIKTVPTAAQSAQQAEMGLPQLLKSVSVNSNGALNSASAAAATSIATASPTPVTTSAAAVLKALAVGQGATSGSGLKLPLPRLASQNSPSNVSKPVAPESPTTVTTPAVAAAVTISSPRNGGRHILPKPVGVVNANVPNPGSSPRSQQKSQTNQSDSALSSGPSPKSTISHGNGLPSYLKAVLNPASVLPYRSVMPPKEYGFLTPEGGYTCEECEDSFALKSCLEFHLQRRSMIIECSCVVCRQPLVFFNKCVYYGHIRQHSGSQRQVGKMVMRNVNVRPITWQLMELAFEDTAFKRMSNIDEFVKYETGRPMVAIDADDQRNDQVAHAKAVGGDGNKATAATNKLALTIYNAANENTTEHAAAAVRMQCSECHVEFGGAPLLRQHFMYDLPPTQKQLICSSCQAVYFSPCSFKAHTRTHTGDAPYVCPECGVIETTHNLLNAHVLTHQKNPTVMDAWRCQKCLTFYSSWDALIVHISAAHCDSYYRCQHCPMAFQSAHAFEQHLQTTHEDLGIIRIADAQVLVKCCQCDIVYMARELLLDHLKTHFQKLMPFMVYRCALCGRLMENKGGLLGHFRNVHRLSVPPAEVFPVKIKVSGNAPTTAGKKSASSANANEKSSASASSSTIFTCPQCPNMMFSDVVSMKSHLKRSHSDAVGMDASSAKKAKPDGKEVADATSSVPVEELSCRLCKRKFPNKESLLEDGRHHLRGGNNVCLLCQNNDCGSASLLRHHLQRHIDMQRSRTTKQHMSFGCEGHCEKMFPSAVQALEHLRQIHLFLPLLCFTCNVNFSDEDELRQHLLRHGNETSPASQATDLTPPVQSPQERESVNLTGERRKGTSDSSSEAPPAAKQRSEDSTDSGSVATVRCNKCGVWFQDTRSMHAHAVSHKEAKYYLCLECGLSFAATSSLGRHLIVAHKIPNADKYLQDHPDSNPDKPSELECSVCHMEFPSKPLLDSHVRTHGLLFLKTKARPSV